MTIDRDWTVLIVGGAPGTGKTRLTQALGRRLDLHVIESDPYLWVLRSAMTREQGPEWYLLMPEDTWTRPYEALTERWMELSRRFSDVFEVVVRNHARWDHPAILEGNLLLPALVARQSEAHPGKVRSIYLFEPDAQILDERFRGRAINPMSDGYVAACIACGLEIKSQAEALGLPVLESRPFDTLLDRALAVLDEPRTS